MKFRIRPVDITDEDVRDQINRMDKKVFPADYLCQKEGLWWIVKTGDGHLAGFCGLKQSSQWDDAGYLCRAGVLPGFRGRGLQRKMIRVREAKARKLGWSCLITDTTDNVHSGNNLIRAGYLMFNPSKPWGPEGAVYWRKWLKKNG